MCVCVVELVNLLVALGYLNAAERGHAHVEEDAVENRHGDELRTEEQKGRSNVTMEQ